MLHSCIDLKSFNSYEYEVKKERKQLNVVNFSFCFQVWRN